MEEDRPPSSLSATVDELVNNALERARLAVIKTLEDNLPDYETRNVNWVTCKDFTVDVGKQQIEEYMRTWEVHPGWLFSLDFLRTDEEEHHTFHHYRACWSIPTPRRPIPKGTVCVYFVIDISKAKPETSPVEVSFVVESNKLVHTPGKTRFREKWLTDVVESKSLLYSILDF
ncbi:A-kinase anchor protein 14 [Centroberyx affinis]|uniref:A-kinase anchor protein 14 n=1 Tax=Centroberyx affinis TaxID=166261 RepID=UPI003A5C35A3